jgi:SAM-dependent methyltransferase
MRRLARELLRKANLLASCRRAYRLLAGGARNAGWLLLGERKANGMPVPSPRLCFRSAASYSTSHFVASGQAGIDSIEHLLERTGSPLTRFRRLLDLGCGSGRIFRHLPASIQTSAVGVDIDREAVRWCARNLPGSFLCSRLSMPLPLEPASFDLVLAVAVVCHLNLAHQKQLLSEMERILEPGGTALVTIKGESRRREIPADLLNDFDGEIPVVVEPEHSGSRYCLAYHPGESLQRLLPPGLTLLERVPLGSRDTRQDACLLQKISG